MSRQLRVAFLCQPFDLVLPPEQTSVGLWTHEVARRLARGCEVSILARRSRGRPVQEAGDWGRLEYLSSAPLRLWSSASLIWSKFGRPSAPLVSQRLYAFDYLAAAIRRLRRVRPDVIHIQNFPVFARPLRRAFPDAAIVLHMHCDWLVEFDHQAVSRHLAAVDTVIGCSAHVAVAAEARFGPASRFAVVPNGAPPRLADKRRPLRKPGLVIFVGRVSPEKGIHTLLEAWPAVVAAHPGAHLEIVGPHSVVPREFLVDLSPDPDVQALARFYSSNKPFASYSEALRQIVPPPIAQTVSFVGHEPHDRVMARIARAHLLVNPSLSESFGMSLVEALSVGTPVVATQVGGMPEIIDATGGGVVVPCNDPEALAKAVTALLSNPDQAVRLASRGSERASHLYSWEHIAALTEKVHHEAVAQRRRSAVSALMPQLRAS